jgi:hypothetical protein
VKGSWKQVEGMMVLGGGRVSKAGWGGVGKEWPAKLLQSQQSERKRNKIKQNKTNKIK